MNTGFSREQRRHPDNPVQPPRSDFERDRDRVLHSTALRRLGSITQVVSVAEGHVFHNRLTHVLKVAQIAHGLAEVILSTPEGRELSIKLGGLDPHVVETAALAHDLGHPPFGHIAEDELDALVKKEHDTDGFEGNAQSFRIVTKLAVRSEESEGLNLTRASLAALLKYPWFRQTGGGKKERKWGAYHTEEEDFHFARASLSNQDSNFRALEAEIMDWADDIAYSVYDLEDFYRAGIIPLDRICSDDWSSFTMEAEQFLSKAFARWKDEMGEQVDSDSYREIFRGMLEFFHFREPYNGSKRHRGNLRLLTSTLIRRYIHAIELNSDALTNNQATIIRKEYADREVKLLKELTWQYVIVNPSLARVQYGQRLIIQRLFSIFMSAATSPKEWKLFPFSIQERLHESKKSGSSPEHARVVADFITGLTEQQAIELYQCLTGRSLGSMLHSSL